MFPSDTDCDMKITLETEMLSLSEDIPFHILMLGDWSGKESRGIDSELPELQPIEINRDNFDEVLKKLNVKVDLDFQGDDKNTVSLHFTKLTDFHPDTILQTLPLFSDLRDIRRRLINSDSFNDAAHEVRSWFPKPENNEVSNFIRQDNSTDILPSLSADLLNQVLAQTVENETLSRTQNIQTSELGEFVKSIVKPHLIQIDITEQSELLMIVDEVTSDLMRRILHHPKFQALESAWRGAYFLIGRTETGADLKIYLLDVGKDKLSADLKTSNNFTQSYFYKILAQGGDPTWTNKPWAVVCGNYTFSLKVDDVAMLIRIAKIANNTNIPFISHINAEIFGFSSFNDVNSSDGWEIFEKSVVNKLWITLRGIPEATHLGLVTPRILARFPYGEKTESTETFYFEEFTDLTVHKKYLWFNPIFAIALLLGQTFRAYGWKMSQNYFRDINNLPIHLYKDENRIQSCMEIIYTQSNYERILEIGLMPLISDVNSDKVRLAMLQSIAYPPASLIGRWS